MRKIEERMCNAVNNRRSFKESNTEVIVSAKGNVFVKLYNTIIFADVDGRRYYCDGGWNTATTSSRLRALGARYSINEKLNECSMTTHREMLNLYYNN